MKKVFSGKKSGNIPKFSVSSSPRYFKFTFIINNTYMNKQKMKGMLTATLFAASMLQPSEVFAITI